ncbi:MAG TPA: hypothetical protein VFS26_02520 [Solirubrobacterales bacterium]|nr:hypothetical protein [Solirubrobacterales bacterium]
MATEIEERIADKLVDARLMARVLESYPDPRPRDIDSGYRCQDRAIEKWPDSVAGWKVTSVWEPEWNPPAGHERLIGPVFSEKVVSVAEGEVARCPVIDGGLCGIEPELIVRLAEDAPAGKTKWTVDEAASLVGEMFLGAEIVTSPVPDLFEQGMSAVAADFCANFGVVVGQSILRWRDLENIEAYCFVGHDLVGHAAMSVRTGPLEGLAFLLGETARRGHSMPQGTLVTTGTITDFHAAVPGQFVRIVYTGIGEIACQMEAAGPSSSDSGE